MLFLLNDTVIDIGDLETSLIDVIGILGLRHDPLKLADMIEMGQAPHFKAGRSREPAYTSRLALASLIALIALKLKADTATFEVGPDAQQPSDVKTQFSLAPTQATGWLSVLGRVNIAGDVGDDGANPGEQRIRRAHV